MCIWGLLPYKESKKGIVKLLGKALVCYAGATAACMPLGI